MVNDSTSITEDLLNNKKENVLKAILGPKGAAAQLSKSIYTSRNSNFKKIFEEMKYESDQIYINEKTINDTQINTQIQKLQKYLKVTTDDNSDTNIEVRTNKYTDINNKFKEGGLVAQLKIFICLLLLYYLTAEKETKDNEVKSEPPINPSSNPSTSTQPSSSSSSSSISNNITMSKIPPVSPPIASHNFKLDPPPSSNSSSSSSSSTQQSSSSSSSSISNNITTPQIPPASPPIGSHNFKLDPPPSSNSSSSSSSPTQQSSSSSSSSSSSAPRDLPEQKVVHPGIIDPDIANKEGIICYAKIEYKAIETKNNYKVCKKCLTENVNAGIKRLNNTGVTIIKLDANKFFASKKVADPRRTNSYSSSAEVNFVYDVPEKYCHVEDYSGQEPIRVTDTSKSTPATLWFYRGFSLPAIFAVNNALKYEGKGELNPNSTAVQSAGNATSPGGNALMGSGTQEESLQFDSEAYLFINTKRAYEEYYLKNKQAMAEQLEASKRMGLPCSVDAWNKTGIFSRGVYSSGVGLRNNGLCDSNGATINIITTAAADYNKEHHGTYMGPKEDSDGTLTSYQKQLITYWDTILRIAYTNGNRNIVLTTGGGGAYKGDNAEIISALFTVLTQHGPRGGICWARCFDNIIFASGSGHVETNLCKHYEDIFGKSYLRRI